MADSNFLVKPLFSCVVVGEVWEGLVVSFLPLPSSAVPS